MEEKETKIEVDLDRFMDNWKSLEKDIEDEYDAKIYVDDKKESTKKELKQGGCFAWTL